MTLTDSSNPFNQKDYYAEQFKQLDITGIENTLTQGLSFEDCLFENCDFSQVDFSLCQFEQCNFVNCNFSLAVLKGARMNAIHFKDCKLLGIDWSLLHWPSIALDSLVAFDSCVLNDSSFYGLTLQALKVVECRCFDVDFREGDFNQGDFSHTDFRGSLFNRTNLSGCDFAESLNYDIDMMINQVKGAKFSRHEAVRLLHSFDIELLD